MMDHTFSFASGDYPKSEYHFRLFI